MGENSKVMTGGRVGEAIKLIGGEGSDLDLVLKLHTDQDSP